MGTLIIKMEIDSMKHPIINTANCIIMRSTMGDTGAATANSTILAVAPVKDNIWEKAADPVRIIIIMMVMGRVA